MGKRHPTCSTGRVPALSMAAALTGSSLTKCFTIDFSNCDRFHAKERLAHQARACSTGHALKATSSACRRSVGSRVAANASTRSGECRAISASTLFLTHKLDWGSTTRPVKSQAY